MDNRQAYSFLGAGINLLTAKEVPGDLRQRVFDDAYIDEIKQVTLLNEANLNFECADSMEEFIEKNSKKIGIKAGVEGLFSLGFERGISKIRTTKVNNKYCALVALYTKQKYTIDTPFIGDLRNKLIIASDLNDPSVDPKTIFETYGTHIVVEGSCGARLEMNAQYTSNSNVSEADLYATLKAQLTHKKADASAGYKASNAEHLEKIASEMNIHINCIGGNSNKFIGIGNSFEQTVAEWIDSLNKDDQPDTFILTDVDKMIPIWKLAQDNARQKELERFFEEMIQQKKKKLMMELYPLTTNTYRIRIPGTSRFVGACQRDGRYCLQLLNINHNPDDEIVNLIRTEHDTYKISFKNYPHKNVEHNPQIVTRPLEIFLSDNICDALHQEWQIIPVINSQNQTLFKVKNYKFGDFWDLNLRSLDPGTPIKINKEVDQLSQLFEFIEA